MWYRVIFYNACSNWANVFGVDISKKSIELAIKRSKILNTSKNCKFEVGDAENLSFDDNCFDFILCYGSLSYFDLDKYFQELKRVLKPKGKLILVDSLGYNPLINYNRKRNIKNYAPNYVNQVRTITHKDLKISQNTLTHTQYITLIFLHFLVSF